MRTGGRAGGWLLVMLVLGGVAAAADGNNFLNRTAELWVQDLRHNRAPVRRGAAFALGQMGVQAAGAVPALVETLQTDQDWSVREAAAFALGQIGSTNFDNRSVPVLLKAATDTRDAELRRSAVYALGRVAMMNGHRDPQQQKELAGELVPTLRQALNDSQASVRQNAAWAMGQLGADGGADAVSSLSQVLGKDADPLVRRDAALALGKFGPVARDALPALMSRFKGDSDAVVRKTALAALVSLVGPDDQATAGEMVKLLRHADDEVARSAAFALANIGGEQSKAAVPVLRQALKDDDDLTRRLAATALASIGPHAEEAVPDLGSALTDPDHEVRRGAAVALSRIGASAREALPALIKVLNNPREQDEVRKYAGEALSFIDPNDPEVVAGLIKLLKDRAHWSIRQRAIWCFSRLRDFKQPGVVEGLTGLLGETGEKDSKFLRYEAAVTLAVRLKGDVPAKVFDVILEALADNTVLVYTGTDSKVSTGASESRMGGTMVEESGQGDWRAEVAKAVIHIGKRANRRDVVEALKKVEKESPDPEARKSATAALKAIQ